MLKKKIATILIVAMVVGTVSSHFAEPTEDLHVVETTESTEAASGPVVEEYMVYVDDDKRIEPGSLSGDVNLSTVGKGLFYDGTDFYFFLDTGIMATSFMYTIQGDRFYFGEDGKMVKNQLISYNNELYYFDINGAMYKNRWYTEEEIDTYDNTVTYTTYYFGPTGRAYRAVNSPIVLKTIDECKYGFNEDGERLEGYYSLDGSKISPDDDPAYVDCMYYFDPQEGGAATTGWHYYSGSIRGDEYDDNEEIVLYFDEKTCRKVFSKDPDKCIGRTIEGQRYMFDGNGVRKNKWYTMDPSRPATRSNTRYFSEEYDGYLSKGWFLAVPPENSVSSDNKKRYENKEEVWYYAMSNGSIVKNCVRKIGNYYYAFDEDGVMQEDCLVKAVGTKFIKSYKLEHLNKANVLLDPKEYGLAHRASDDDSFDAEGGLLDVAAGERWMYFVGEVENEDKVGAMSNLNTPVKLELSDGELYLIASSIGGYAKASNNDDLSTKVTEVLTRNNKYIQNGILLRPNPDDNNYGIVKYNASRTPYQKYVDWKGARRNTDSGDSGDGKAYRYIVVNSGGGVVGRNPTEVRANEQAGDPEPGGRKCVKDKQGNYIYIGGNGEFIGCYSVQGRVVSASEPKSSGSQIVWKKGQELWQYKVDKEWIEGLPPESYRVDPEYMYLNFKSKILNDSGNFIPAGPYVDGYARFVYDEDGTFESVS